ncbi:unnamed protein product [Lasius platythorax]|uniref:Uncharacterized protein n=1 Tax=Lasius platythorax TaxID=488582 RepID=A0AAV2NA25_9HYME
MSSAWEYPRDERELLTAHRTGSNFFDRSADFAYRMGTGLISIRAPQASRRRQTSGASPRERGQDCADAVPAVMRRVNPGRAAGPGVRI